MPRPRRPLEHGTVHGYSVHRCRCDDCRAANTAYHRDLAARKRAGLPVQDRGRKSADEGHGTVRRYWRGCRCDECRTARRTYVAEWKLRTGRTARSRLLTPPTEDGPSAVQVAALLAERERVLSLVIASGPRSSRAREAAVRRTEVRALRRRLEGATA